MSSIFDHPEEHLSWPQDFSVRVIFDRDHLDTMASQVSAAALRAGIEHPRTGTPSPAGTRYARLSCQVLIPDREAMLALYREIAALPGVKSVL